MEGELLEQVGRFERPELGQNYYPRIDVDSDESNWM
jgi:hypothetical protein